MVVVVVLSVGEWIRLIAAGKVLGEPFDPNTGGEWMNGINDGN